MTRPRALVFGEVAELYDRVRPSYPEALVDDVMRCARLRGGERVLEIGAGTGKATVLFGRRGLHVTALEPSPEMARVLRVATEGVEGCEVIPSTFEAWDPAPGRFPLVYSAQAWHWTAPEVRLAKAHTALEGDGCIALFWNVPDWRGNPLRPALDAVYERVAPELLTRGSGFGGSKVASSAVDAAAELTGSGLFRDVRKEMYRWREHYATARYVQLLSTHSDHRVLPADARARLLHGVAEVVDAHGGLVELDYVTELYLARRAEP